jgi:FkbM family methyltransferase
VSQRQVLSAKVARSTFLHRVMTLRARTNARDAAEREAQFLSIAPAYRAALGANAHPKDAQAMHIDGVTWWVPAKAVKGEIGSRLPYPGILRTREVVMGGIMLDLGANMGRMSIPRVIFGDATAAYCAEPDPSNFECLTRTVVDNGLRGLVLPDQTAIGDREGVVRLLRAGRSGAYRVLADGESRQKDVVEVPCVTLDAWVERLQIDLDAVTFIKVDVEGFERRVIAGASRVLSHPHIAWQMEIKPTGLREAGDDTETLYAALRTSFSHFIDLKRQALGPRVRRSAELSDGLRYLEPDGKTDILLFTASPGVEV